MKVVVLGATGNIGTAVMTRLSSDERITDLVGVARRLPRDSAAEQVSWHASDIRTADWRSLLADADAVVHLAWMFQPSREPDVTWSTNVTALDRLLSALPHTPVSHLVMASSIAAYSPGPGPGAVDESWPTHGASAAAYCREKAYVERLLDQAEGTVPVITRIRPAFVFQRHAASEQKRIFAGRVLPQRVLRPDLLPVLPAPRGLRLQTVHASDVADGLARILAARAAGPFNLCADDVVWPDDLGRIMGARAVTVPQGLVRGALSAASAIRLVPVDPRLLDAVLRVPVMTAARATRELGWQPRHSAEATLRELVHGVAEGAGAGTEPLAPA